jgi:hypothetical protein
MLDTNQWPNDFSPAEANNPGLLDSTETARLADFFSNPDIASAEDQLFGLNLPPGLNMAESTFGNMVGGLDQPGQTISNPHETLANSQSLNNYHVQSDRQIQHSRPSSKIDDTAPAESVAQEDPAAILYSLYQQNNQNSYESGDPTLAASWGNMVNPAFADAHDNHVASSSGQPFANHHSHYNHFPQSNYHPLSNNWTQSWNQETQHHHLPTGIPPFHPSNHQSNLGHMQGHFFYGSDPNFAGPNSYLGHPQYLKIEQQKEANLTGVPFAPGLAADAQKHMPPTPQSNQGSSNGLSGSRQVMSAAPQNSHNFQSAMPTQTPTLADPRRYSQIHTQKVIPTTENTAQSHTGVMQQQQRKRRQSQTGGDDDVEYTPGHVKGGAQVKSEQDSDYDNSSAYRPSNSQTMSSAKRRKSTLGNARSPAEDDEEAVRSSSEELTPTGSKRNRGKSISQARQNLTDTQKRENHIKSEKMRRDLIKIQYDTLDELVPALKGGKSGLSRADILNEITEYVETVQFGNQAVGNALQRRAIILGQQSQNSPFASGSGTSPFAGPSASPGAARPQAVKNDDADAEGDEDSENGGVGAAKTTAHNAGSRQSGGSPGN